MKQTKHNKISLIPTPMSEGKTAIWREEMSPTNEVSKEVKVALHTMLEQRRLPNPYQGHNSAEFTHNNKFHRTSSEAFRNADYASWFEKDSEMSDMKLFSLEFLTMLPFLIGLFYLVKYVIMYYK